MREPLEKEYFETHVRPNLGWGIEYLGEISHEEKVSLLQHARATLFPISWEEPFGLVMIESMACGTPVIATRWGAVSEVIEHGRDGLIVDDHLEMVDAIARPTASAAQCRRASRSASPPAHGARLREAYQAVGRAAA
jgi:glycosyltransferase involved in cell wall biosynthesis